VSNSFQLSSDRTHPVTKIVGFTILGLVLIAWLTPDAPPVTPQQAAAATTQNNRERTAYVGVFTLKTAMRNPDSFRLDSVHVSDAGVACIEYRAQNGFGGMNRESALIGNGYAAMSSDKPGDFVRAWNKECKGVYDMTNYVQARL
jgi:hypothetical protein